MTPTKRSVADLLTGWVRASRFVEPALRGDPGVTWAHARATYGAELASLTQVPEDVTFGASTIGGVPSLVVDAEGGHRTRSVLYIHGGGYVHGAVDPYRAIAGKLALNLHAQVIVPDYRQAPEHPFPTPIDDVLAVYRDMLAQGRSVVLVGDSAGGAMTVTIMRKARNAGLAQPVAAVAISPWADLTNSGPSMKTRGGADPSGEQGYLDRLAHAFLGGVVPTHADASPVYADLHDLAPRLSRSGKTK